MTRALSRLRLLRWWVARNPERRARLLLRFAETEADGGRDLVRAAEVTGDPVLRRLYLRHAADEERHASLFRQQGAALLRGMRKKWGRRARRAWLPPGERGLDDLRVEGESDGALLAFLHLSEKAAAKDFAAYRDLLHDDPTTRAVFDDILHDEAFHMTYTRTQLARVAPDQHRRLLWRARLSRLWKAYLRLATALASVIGTAILTMIYFVVLPPFAVIAKRAARREAVGWIAIPAERQRPLESQY